MRTPWNTICNWPPSAWVLVALCGPLGAWLSVRSGWALAAQGCSGLGLLSLLLLAPVAEEIVFRKALHKPLLQILPESLARLGWANGLTAICFGIAHAVNQGSVHAMAVAVPASVIGWLWEKSSQRILVAIGVHSWFNACMALLSC
ncbi:MAG: JDVT-CTERM system glutamic-type intramembrane protease MrtJ [Rhodoferax sp.]